MSYDLFLVRAPADATDDAIAQMAFEAAERAPVETEEDPASAARIRQLVAALQVIDPALQPFAFDHTEIARLDGITESQARRRYRHVELNGPEDGLPVQITLYDDWASLTLPYSSRGPDADALWDRVWDYLRVLVDVGGFTVYDPQMERVLDLDEDRPSAAAIYDKGASVMDAILQRPTSEEARARRPWWKFW